MPSVFNFLIFLLQLQLCIGKTILMYIVLVLDFFLVRQLGEILLMLLSRSASLAS